jgi:glycosyltransferase involved in cell wall biosynthesis
MKILQVTMQFGRSYAQGTERYVATLSEGLLERGHDVSVLAGDPLHLGPALALGEPLQGEQQVLAYPTRGWMAVMGLSPRTLTYWLRQHRPDVVHVNTPAHIGVGIMSACRRLGIPCVVTVHDYWWICPKGTLLRPGGQVCDGTPGWATCVRCLAGDHARAWVRWLARVPLVSSPLLLAMYFARAAGRGMSPADMARWLRRRSLLTRQLAAADFVIFPSKAIAQVIASYLGHSHWRIIPNGLVKAWFENPRPPADGVKEPADLTIGFAGSLAPHKAPHL